MRALCILLLVACEQRVPAGPGYRVSGRVRVDDAPGVVRAVLDGASSAEVDAFGDFVFSDVKPGNHIVTAVADFATLEGPVATAVTVQQSAVDSVLLDLTPIGRVTGTVLAASGAPVSGARVFAAGTQAATFSQPDGGFVLERVPLGKRAIVATKDGAATRQPDIAITPDGLVPVVLQFGMDGGRNPNAPNELPIIESLTWAPEDNRGDNPRVIPAASDKRKDLVHPFSTLVFDVKAHDPEGEALSYLWSVDKGSLEGGDVPNVTWTTGNQDAEVVVVVFDPQGGSATARQRFVVPQRTIRGAALWRDEIIYSEERDDDSRDILGFNLATNAERVVFGAADEQHAPRVIGDTLMFSDQVFTFVQPIVFRLRKLDLLAPNAPSITYGKQLTPDETFNVDFRLYTALSGTRVTYVSSDPQVAPTGIGLFDPITGDYETFASFSGAGPAPSFPCYVRDGVGTYGVQGGNLYRYNAGARSFVTTLPAAACAEMQVSGNFAAIRMSTPSDALIVVDLQSGDIREIGFGARSFALFDTKLAYSDERAGFTGVFVEDLESGEAFAVPVVGARDRRVLALSGSRLVFGEREVRTGNNFYSVESLWYFEY